MPRLPSTLSWLDRNGKLVVAASAVRSVDYSFLAAFLGVYLSLLDFTALEAGIVFSGIMAGAAISNVVASWKGDAIGRRRMLVLMSALMVVGGALFPFTSSPWALAAVGLLAMTSSTGGDRTALSSLDMAILAQSCGTRHRTLAFSWYNLVSVGAKSLGALMVALPPLLQSWAGLEELAAFKAMFGLYCLIAVAGGLLYVALSPSAEAARGGARAARQPSGDHRGVMLRLTGLFSMDALGGGFMVKGFISYWFVTRFGMDLNTLAAVFFAGQLLNVVSIVLAAPVAGRLGLINTMAVSQVLSNAAMMAVPLTDSVWLAVAFLLTRELLNDMDIPARQSYTMAIVPPEQRTAMAGVTNLGRNVAQMVSPTLAGYAASTAFLGAPFLIGGAIKIAYNAILYAMFRDVKTPEEAPTAARASGEAASSGAGRGR